MGDFIELAEDGESASQRIADALKDANEASTFDGKIKALTVAMHILVDPIRPKYLLDNFLDEMLEFSELGESRIICLLIDFLQKSCVKDPEFCIKAVERFNGYLSGDVNVLKYFKVIKRVIVASTNIYPIILEMAIKRSQDNEAERYWETFQILKSKIIALIDSENDGIRTCAFKFIEVLVMCQSPKSKDDTVPGVIQNLPPPATELNSRFSKISLNDIPRNHSFLSFRKCQSEAENNFQTLLKQTEVLHITAQNLLTVIDSLCIIARHRPIWDDCLVRVIEAFEVLHVNLPPTLGNSQIKTVRKELKRNLIRFLKLPRSFPIQSKICSLLVYLGASQNEINRAIPPHLTQKANKVRQAPSDATSIAGPSAPKKAKSNDSSVSGAFFNYDEDEEATPSTSTLRKKDATSSAVDETAEFIFSKLTPNVVTNLVLISVATLPDEMPPSFISSYTPIAGAGEEKQRRDLSRMMAMQATQAKVGPGYERLKKENPEKTKSPAEQKPNISNLKKSNQKPAAVDAQKVQMVKTKKTFNLLETAKEMSRAELKELFELAFESVLRSERRVVHGGATSLYQQLVVRLASRFDEDTLQYETIILNHIVEDHKKRADLALLWICELYAQYQGYTYCAAWLKEQVEAVATKEIRYERYDRVVCSLLRVLMEKELHTEAIFHRILLESPMITKNALQWLKVACLDKVFGAFGMTALRELILTRNRQRPELLQFFFSLCFYDKPELRSGCVDTAKELCALPHIKRALTDQAILQLQDCLESSPPEHFQNPEQRSDDWKEETYKSALLIYLTILPFDSTLLFPLASVYATGTTLFKKVVLKAIEPAVKAIGMRDEQMLRLIDECPQNGETLVARVVHLLTERAPATPELVLRVKKLHDERHTDIRALIPIIGGLSMEEVIQLLPQFVLRAEYHKSVNLAFRRLYNARDLTTGELCFSSIDLIVEYHKIKPQTEKETRLHIENLEELLDPRYVSRDSACKAIEFIYEFRPLPYIFFYTLIQVHAKFTSLESFLTNIFYKVCNKQLWKEDDLTKEAFFNAIGKLGSITYGSILPSFNLEELNELIEFKGPELLEEFKKFFTSMSSSQQKSVDEEVRAVVYDREKDEREKRERREERRERDKERERLRDKEDRRRSHR